MNAVRFELAGTLLALDSKSELAAGGGRVQFHSKQLAGALPLDAHRRSARGASCRHSVAAEGGASRGCARRIARDLSDETTPPTLSHSPRRSVRTRFNAWIRRNSEGALVHQRGHDCRGDFLTLWSIEAREMLAENLWATVTSGKPRLPRRRVPTHLVVFHRHALRTFMAAAEIAFAHGLVSRASEALRNAEAMKDAAEEQAKEEMSSVSPSSSRGLSLSATSRFARPSRFP